MFETFIQVMSVCYLARKQADAGYLVTTLSLPSFPFPWVWNMMAVLCVVYVRAYTCVCVRVCVCACVRVCARVSDYMCVQSSSDSYCFFSVVMMTIHASSWKQCCFARGCTKKR